jgi:hypothetical protein
MTLLVHNPAAAHVLENAVGAQKEGVVAHTRTDSEAKASKTGMNRSETCPRRHRARNYRVFERRKFLSVGTGPGIRQSDYTKSRHASRIVKRKKIQGQYVKAKQNILHNQTERTNTS